jgi:hypothetical protein
MPLIRSIPYALLTAILAAALSLRPAPCFAHTGDQVTVRVEAPSQIYLGDTVALQVVITGSRNAEPPDLSGLRDFEAVYRGPQDMSSTMTTIINGRVETTSSITYSHLYAITPKRAGRLEFPSLSVVVDGRTFTTRPVTIEVVEPTQAPGFKLELIAAPSSLFVGQPANIKIVWTIDASIRDLRNVVLSLPITGVEHDLQPGPDPRQFGQGDGEIVQINLNNEMVFGRFEKSAITINLVLIPKHAGIIAIGPARADFLVVGPYSRSPMDRHYSIAPALALPIDDLPTAGKPPNFSGLVGDYQIAASADATNISVGDPINLTLNVTGPYPLSLVPPLDLARQSDMRTQFRLPRDPVLPRITPNAAVFSAMVRPRTPDATEIGPVSITCFDPDAKQYKVASSNPIPLTVHASSSVTLPDQPDNEPAPPKALRQNLPGGLPGIDRTPLSPGAPSFNIRNALLSPIALSILFLPPLACAAAAGFLAFLRWRERDPAALRRRAAVTKLRRAITRPGTTSLDPLARALSNFAADLFDQPRDAVTGAHAAALLAQTGVPAGTQLADLLLACDETRFGIAHAAGADRSPATLAREALAAARALTRQLRAGRRAAA